MTQLTKKKHKSLLEDVRKGDNNNNNKQEVKSCFDFEKGIYIKNS